MVEWIYTEGYNEVKTPCHFILELGIKTMFALFAPQFFIKIQDERE